jgi:GNAT superfamily N-acetyltransferase
MLKKCAPGDFAEIHTIINDAAIAYKGIIPDDCWHEPYMTVDELTSQLEQGVDFWGYFEAGVLIGVMGIQEKHDVTLVRHAYVRTQFRSKGIGARLLQHLTTLTTKPVLIGTWADAAWAIAFYQKYGFRLVTEKEKDELLGRYWNIPPRQKETSVVLTSASWAAPVAGK